MDLSFVFLLACLFVEHADDEGGFVWGGVMVEDLLRGDEEPGVEILGVEGEGGGAGDVGLIVLGQE